MFLVKALRDQYFHALPGQFSGGIPEQALGLGVDQDDLAVPVGDDHGVGCGFEQAPEFSLAGRQRGEVRIGVSHSQKT